MQATCRYCGYNFKPRTDTPRKCPNIRCQKFWPLGEPINGAQAEIFSDPAYGKKPYRVVREMRGMDGPATWMVLDDADNFLGDFGPAEEWGDDGRRNLDDGRLRAELFKQALEKV